MALKISDRLSKPRKTVNDSKSRLKKATALVNNIDSRDEVLLNNDNSICIIKLYNISFLSYNDLLRLDNRSIYPFKMAWHKRLARLFNSVNMDDWLLHNNEPKLIEFLYKTKNAQTYDPDSIVSAFKSTLDGLVDVGILDDDNEKNLPMIIAKQEKTKGENSLYIVISPIGNIERFYSDAFKMVI